MSALSPHFTDTKTKIWRTFISFIAIATLIFAILNIPPLHIWKDARRNMSDEPATSDAVGTNLPPIMMPTPSTTPGRRLGEIPSSTRSRTRSAIKTDDEVAPTTVSSSTSRSRTITTTRDLLDPPIVRDKRVPEEDTMSELAGTLPVTVQSVGPTSTSTADQDDTSESVGPTTSEGINPTSSSGSTNHPVTTSIATSAYVVGFSEYTKLGNDALPPGYRSSAARNARISPFLRLLAHLFVFSTNTAAIVASSVSPGAPNTPYMTPHVPSMTSISTANNITITPTPTPTSSLLPLGFPKIDVPKIDVPNILDHIESKATEVGSEVQNAASTAANIATKAAEDAKDAMPQIEIRFPDFKFSDRVWEGLDGMRSPPFRKKGSDGQTSAGSSLWGGRRMRNSEKGSRGENNITDLPSILFCPWLVYIIVGLVISGFLLFVVLLIIFLVTVLPIYFKLKGFLDKFHGKWDELARVFDTVTDKLDGVKDEVEEKLKAFWKGEIGDQTKLVADEVEEWVKKVLKAPLEKIPGVKLKWDKRDILDLVVDGQEEAAEGERRALVSDSRSPEVKEMVPFPTMRTETLPLGTAVSAGEAGAIAVANNVSYQALSSGASRLGAFSLLALLFRRR